MRGEDFAALCEVAVEDGAFRERLRIGEFRTVVDGEPEKVDGVSRGENDVECVHGAVGGNPEGEVA